MRWQGRRRWHHHVSHHLNLYFFLFFKMTINESWCFHFSSNLIITITLKPSFLTPCLSVGLFPSLSVSPGGRRPLGPHQTSICWFEWQRPPSPLRCGKKYLWNQGGGRHQILSSHLWVSYWRVGILYQNKPPQRWRSILCSHHRWTTSPSTSYPPWGL